MKSTAFHFQRNDILYGRLRPYLNKVLLAGFEGLCSSEFIVLPPADTFEPEYLAFYLNNDGFVTFANSLNQGDRPRVSFDQMGDHEVPLPPLAEQKRIVAKLEVLLGKVDSCRKRLERIPVILKAFRQSVLAAACSGRLTTDWREQNPSKDQGSLGVQETSAEEVPNDWRNQPLLDFLESSFYGPRFGAGNYSQTGVPTVRTTDMGFDGSIVLKDAPRLTLSSREFEKYSLQDGDLVVTRTGATIGKCALYDKLLGPAIPGAYLIRFRFNRELVVPKYVLRFLMSPQGQNLLVGGSTAVAQPNVNATTISHFMVPLPPLLEQHEIVRRVDALFALADQTGTRCAKSKTHVDRLTQSILAKAFRGDLVPQDPNDEPATVLLERIRSQQTTKISPKKGAGRRHD